MGASRGDCSSVCEEQEGGRFVFYMSCPGDGPEKA